MSDTSDAQAALAAADAATIASITNTLTPLIATQIAARVALTTLVAPNNAPSIILEHARADTCVVLNQWWQTQRQTFGGNVHQHTVFVNIDLATGR
jgi:hypothetical protein